MNIQLIQKEERWVTHQEGYTILRDKINEIITALKEKEPWISVCHDCYDGCHCYGSGKPCHCDCTKENGGREEIDPDQIAYCGNCIQMTNHKDGVCLKCWVRVVGPIEDKVGFCYVCYTTHHGDTRCGVYSMMGERCIHTKGKCPLHGKKESSWVSTKTGEDVYIRLNKNAIHHTTSVSTGINLDIDSKGNLIGIEILGDVEKSPMYDLQSDTWKLGYEQGKKDEQERIKTLIGKYEKDDEYSWLDLLKELEK